MTDIDEHDDASWASRLDDGPLDAQAALALQQWLDGDPRRAGALLRAEACLAQMRRLREATDPPVMTDRQWPVLSRRRAGQLIAGGIAVAASAAGVMLWPAGGTAYRTGIGEVRRVPLGDGSIASINTSSSLKVTMTDDRRRIVLDRGEAWFQVAHDRSRPFVVDAGKIEVRAVGTSFSMRRRAEGVDLLVTEGTVEAFTGAATMRVVAGEAIFLTENGRSRRPERRPEEVERALAWRHGEVAFENQTLAEAAAEINRYNIVRIEVDDRIAGQTLVGYFRTNDPLAFARTVATINGGSVVSKGGTIRILPDPPFHHPPK